MPPPPPYIPESTLQQHARLVQARQGARRSPYQSRPQSPLAEPWGRGSPIQYGSVTPDQQEVLEEDVVLAEFSEDKTWFIVTGIVIGLTLILTIIYAAGGLQFGDSGLSTCCTPSALNDLRRCGARAQCMTREQFLHNPNNTWLPIIPGASKSIHACAAQRDSVRLCVWTGGDAGSCSQQCAVAPLQWDYDALLVCVFALVWAFSAIMVIVVVVRRLRMPRVSPTVTSFTTSGGSEYQGEGGDRGRLLEGDLRANGLVDYPSRILRRLPRPSLSLGLWLVTLLLAACVWAAAEGASKGAPPTVLAATVCRNVSTGTNSSTVCGANQTFVDLATTSSGTLLPAKEFGVGEPMNFGWDKLTLCLRGNQTVVVDGNSSLIGYDQCITGGDSGESLLNISYFVDTEMSPTRTTALFFALSLTAPG